VVNVANKGEGSAETDCTDYQEKCIAHASIIAKEEG